MIDLRELARIARSSELHDLKVGLTPDEAERIADEIDRWRDRCLERGYESIRRGEKIASLQMRLQQSQEIRADMEQLLSMIGDRLGVPEEPHQTWQERLLEALPTKDGLHPDCRGPWDRGETDYSKEEHIRDCPKCQDVTTKDQPRDAACLDAGCPIEGNEHQPWCDNRETEKGS